MLWTPFEIRFKNLLQRMDRHRGYVESELGLMTAWISYNSKVTKDTQYRLEVRERQATETSRGMIAYISAQSGKIEELLKEKQESKLD
jgi:hypothetical protein